MVECRVPSLLSLPDAQRGEMERDFKEIDALACEGGVKAIMDEAEWHSENLAEILGEHDDLHEKAFWVFLERPKYWPAARAFCHADSIGGSQWNESRASDHPPAGVDDASIQDLEGISKNPNSVAMLRCSKNFNAYISNICGALKFFSRLVLLRI